MDTWKYFDITHSEHTICNPLSDAKFNGLIDLLRLESNSDVLDMAMGKGELIIRLAERYNKVRGIGIDLSPFCVAETREKLNLRVPEADITILEMDGTAYQPEKPEAFDLAACLGATWIYDGYAGTVQALMNMTVAGGWVVIGEPYWLKDPSEAYFKAMDVKRDAYNTHAQNVQVGEELGLTLVYTIVSNLDDWDQYEGLQWYATEAYARTHPEDPDIEELLQRVQRHKQLYFAWERDTVGWAVYLFRKAVK